MDVDRAPSILSEISHLKRLLDQINEELELHIRSTRDIESKILKKSEEEKDLMKEEEKWKMFLIVKDHRFKDLNVLREKYHDNLLQENGGIQAMEIKRNNMISKICEEREKFISCCNLFQEVMDNPKTSLERTKLMSAKEDLQQNFCSLKRMAEVTEASTRSLLQERSRYLQNLRHEEKGLCDLLQDKIIENEKVLKEVACHKKTLQDIQAVSEQISREIQENNEARRQLKDCILGLQIQFPHLIA